MRVCECGRVRLGNQPEHRALPETMSVHSHMKMNRRVFDPHHLTSPLASRRAREWLAAANDMVPRSRLQIAPVDEPELPMTISFEGLSPEEQRVALAAFPGGKRFVLEG